MKHEDYKLPGGRDLSTITFEDIQWQYGVFRCNSTGAGRDKKYFPWRGAKTKLGEIEERNWCRLAEAAIEYAEKPCSSIQAGFSITPSGSDTYPLINGTGQRFGMRQTLSLCA